MPFLSSKIFLALLLYGTAAQASLVAYWPFSAAGTLGNDAVGGSVLTVNGATFAAAGKNGGGLVLSGASQFLSGNVANLPVGNSNYTQAAWIKPTVLGPQGIVGWGNYGNARQTNALCMADAGNGLRHYWWAADLDTVGITTVLNNGSWHHVATTFDGTNRRIYLDGVQVATDAPGVNAATSANFRIGSTNNGEFFNGVLDDVALYNHALTDAQVLALYNGATPTAGPAINSFTAVPGNAYEGGVIALSWNVGTSNVTGTFGYEILLAGNVVSSGPAAMGTFNTTVPNLFGTAQTLTWTLRATETGGNNVTTTATATVAADPGIPTSASQAGLTTSSSAPLSITLAGNDPNGGSLSYLIVTPPRHGTLSSGSSATKIYTPTPGVYGADSFSYKVNPPVGYQSRRRRIAP